MPRGKKPPASEELPDMGEEWETVLERETELNTKHSPKHPVLEDLHLIACAVSARKAPGPDANPPSVEGRELEAEFPGAVAAWGRRCLSAYLRNDWQFFDSLQRATSVWGNRRPAKKQGQVQQAEVIRIAVDLFYKLARNPSADEVKAEAKKAGISVAAWNKTIAACRLTFLEGAIKNPGRPKK